MRHHKTQRKFGLKRNVRLGLMRSLLRSVILHEKIQTTEAKAKEIRPLVEKLVTIGKSDSVESRRLIFKKVPSQMVVKKLVEKISPRYESRKGGYTRIVKVAARKSDAAKMAIIEFVK